MNEKELTFISIDHVNILGLVLSMAKHQIGEISDEEFKRQISGIETLYSQAQQRATMKALKDLLDEVGEKTE